MSTICRFTDCKSSGHLNMILLDVKGKSFELVWCSICGRIQNKFK